MSGREPDYEPPLVGEDQAVPHTREEEMLEAARAYRAADRAGPSPCNDCRHLGVMKYRGQGIAGMYCTLLGMKLMATVESCSLRSERTSA